MCVRSLLWLSGGERCRVQLKWRVLRRLWFDQCTDAVELAHVLCRWLAFAAAATTAPATSLTTASLTTTSIAAPVAANHVHRLLARVQLLRAV